MNIIESIIRIENAKQAIKEAIKAKGVRVSDADSLDIYADKINNIIGESGASRIKITKSFKMLTEIKYDKAHAVFLKIFVPDSFEVITEKEA